MSEKEDQRVGRNKETQINKAYIESGEYRRKFDRISDNPELNRLTYDLSKQMLKHRSGTLKEDMYWIDIEDCKVVGKETDSELDGRIIYSKNTFSMIEKYKQGKKKVLLTLHTHPSSFPPSIDDLNSNYNNEYYAGLIICHNGKIYLYSSDEFINKTYYEIRVADYFSRGYNEDEAQIRALIDMKKYFEIEFEEVCAYDYGKRYI